MKSTYDFPTIREACQPLSGYGAGDMRSTGLRSTKGLRMRATEGVTVNVKTAVGVTGGFVTESQTPLSQRKLSKNARRKARRYGKLPR